MGNRQWRGLMEVLQEKKLGRRETAQVKCYRAPQYRKTAGETVPVISALQRWRQKVQKPRASSPTKKNLGPLYRPSGSRKEG